jgi:hypothetical protein
MNKTLRLTLLSLLMLVCGGVFADYQKVTAVDQLKDGGKYLIVYETGSVAFNGALTTLDATSNKVDVTISNGEIVSTDEIDAAAFTIDTTNGTVKSSSGYYIGISSYSNGLKTSDNASTYTNDIAFDNDGNFLLSKTFTGGTMTLKFNNASDQQRFRYYKSGQQSIQLYMEKETSVEIPWRDIKIDLTNNNLLTDGEAEPWQNVPEMGISVAENGALTRVAADAATAVAVLSGKYHSTDNGWATTKLVVPVKAGNYKLSFGTNPNGNTDQITLSDLTGNTTLIDAQGYRLQAGDNKKSPTYSTANASVVTYYYIATEATTVTIENKNYSGYISIEATDDVIPDEPATSKVTFAAGDATGIVPEAIVADKQASITLPTNYALYVQGKTLTGWNDGTNTYEPGAAYTVPNADVTLTAVFTDNEVALADRTEDVTIQWNFVKNQGAPLIAWEHSGDQTYVAQATIGGKTIDVPMTINTASGKFNTSNGDWAQVNNGTTFTVPACKGALVTLYSMNDASANTFNGNQGTYANCETTYTEADETDNIVVSIAGGSWYKYISVKLPYVEPVVEPAFDPATVIVNAGFEDCEAVTDNLSTGKNLGTDYTANGWTLFTGADWGNSAVFAYGSTNTLNTVTAPAADNEGNGGKALGVSSAWGSDNMQYYRSATPVTLPAGMYTLKAHAYNGFATAQAMTSMLGFIPTTGDAFLSTRNSYPSNQWVVDEVSFILTEETEGCFQVGGKAGDGGSANQARVFFDNLTLEYKALSDFSYANPSADLLVNGSCDVADQGWTLTNMGYQQNTERPTRYIEKWSDKPLSGSGSATQTVKNLPAGAYMLKGVVHTNKTEEGEGVKLSVNDQYVAASGAWKDYTIIYNLEQPGDITVSFSYDNVASNWVGIDELSLVYGGDYNQFVADKKIADDLIAAELATAKQALSDKVNEGKDADTANKTEASVKDLNDAISAAEALLEKADATKAEYEAAATAIDQAIAGLEDVVPLYDITADYLTNPSFETGDLTGWTISEESSDTGVKDNADQYATTGIDGNKLFNTWWKGVALSQTAKNLPAGTYTVSAILATSDDGVDGKVFLQLNNERKLFTFPKGTKGTGVKCEFKATLAETGDLTITTIGANDAGEYVEGGHWWYKADDFHLYFQGTQEAFETAAAAVAAAELAADKEALQQQINAASQIDQTLYSDETAAALAQAITDAQTAHDANDATKATLAAAAEALQQAINALVTKAAAETAAAQEALQQKLATAKQTSTEGMTEASVKALQKAIAEAEATLKGTEVVPVSYFNDCAGGTIPEGYKVYFGSDIRTSAQQYNGGPRMFAGFSGDFTHGLYFREGKVEYGTAEDHALTLAAGTKYIVCFNAAQWKDNGTQMKFQIVKADATDTPLLSEVIDPAPNVNGNSTMSVTGSTRAEIPFVPENDGDYLLQWISDGFREYALANAQLLKEATKDECQAAETALDEAIAGLESAAELTAAQQAMKQKLAAAEQTSIEGMTQESAQALTDAIAAAKELLVEELLPVSFMNDSPASTIPTGYKVKFEEEFRESGSGQGTGPRLFDGFSGDFTKALYFRAGYAEFGSTDGFALNLEAGKEYTVSFNSASWKGNTEMKFQILKADATDAPVVEKSISNAPNVDGQKIEVTGSTFTELTFKPETAGSYLLRWVDPAYNEILLANAQMKYDPKTTKAQFEAATTALDEAINGLVSQAFATAKEELKQAIDDAKALDKDLYTEDSQTALANAISAAETALNATNATTESLGNAKTDLGTALAGLVTKAAAELAAAKEALQQKVTDAAAVSTEGKTQESAQALADAISAANTLLANADATKAELEAAATAIDQAIAGLQDEAPQVQLYDITADYLTNPSFETGDLTGWTTVGTSSDTGVRDNTNQFATTGIDGQKLFNTWWQGVPLTQTAKNLPAGTYTVSAILATSDDNKDGKVFMLLNNERKLFTFPMGTKGTGVKCEISATLAEAGDLTITVVGGNDAGEYVEAGHWWYKADDFHLAFNGTQAEFEQAQAAQQAAAELAAAKEALQQKVTDAADVSTEGKTQESAQALADAISNANTLLANADATKAELEAAATAIDQAIAGLQDEPQQPEPTYAQKWDFINMQTTVDQFAADQTNWVVDASNAELFTYQPATTKSALNLGSEELADTKDLRFTAAAKKIRIEVGKRLNLNGASIVITIPNLTKGQKLTVYAKSSNANSERSFNVTNLKVVSGFELTTEEQVNVGTVEADGDVTLTTTGGMNVTKITVEDQGEEELLAAAIAELNDEIAKAQQQLQEADANADGRTEFEQAIAAAQAVAGNTATTQAEAEQALADLKIAEQTFKTASQGMEFNEYVLDATTATVVKDAESPWTFTSNGKDFQITSSKKYAAGTANTVKYSRNVTFTIVLPNDVAVQNIVFKGYSNHDTDDSYLSEVNGESLSNEHMFGTSTESLSVYNYSLQDPKQGGEITFTVKGQQSCFIIILNGTETTTGISDVFAARQWRGTTIYNLRGQKVEQPVKGGLYIVNGKKMVLK